jgi:hypothetical protein
MSLPLRANDMSQHNDRDIDSQIDPMVSDQVRALADETTPNDLDRAVMREAKQALRADNRRGSFGAWFRPVAFMATIGLSLAIILDLTDRSIFAPESGPSVGLRPTGTLDELKRQEKSSAGDAFTAESQKARERLQDLEVNYDASTPEPSMDAVLQTPPAECSDVEKSAAQTWWQCIESLREAGQLEAANWQLENLRNEFSEFVPPE